jgi:DNA-binding response OmpR family regulator
MQKSVLIVEDEFLIALDLKLMLEGAGWRVIGPAATVRDALRLLETELPSVALLDVNLGREMVAPVAEVLKERGVPFALASAYEMAERYGGAVLAGVPNVGKPASDRRVLATLAELTAS